MLGRFIDRIYIYSNKIDINPFIGDYLINLKIFLNYFHRVARFNERTR